MHALLSGFWFENVFKVMPKYYVIKRVGLCYKGDDISISKSPFAPDHEG